MRGSTGNLGQKTHDRPNCFPVESREARWWDSVYSRPSQQPRDARSCALFWHGRAYFFCNFRQKLGGANLAKYGMILRPHPQFLSNDRLRQRVLQHIFLSDVHIFTWLTATRSWPYIPIRNSHNWTQTRDAVPQVQPVDAHVPGVANFVGSSKWASS